MKKRLFLLTGCVMLFVASAHAGKEIWHYVSLPLIEGAGIYASVKSLTDDNGGALTQAASIANLSFLGANAALGMITVFSNDDARYKLRTVHRIIGFTVSAAALWLSISASVDEVDTSARIVSYAYTGMSVVPIIMFSF
jgi:heme A synthase